MNRQADIIDQAAATADAEIAYLINKHASRKKVNSTEYCVNCDEHIPQTRQIVTGGTDHCIDCQSELERKR